MRARRPTLGAVDEEHEPGDLGVKGEEGMKRHLDALMLFVFQMANQSVHIPAVARVSVNGTHCAYSL